MLKFEFGTVYLGNMSHYGPCYGQCAYNGCRIGNPWVGDADELRRTEHKLTGDVGHYDGRNQGEVAIVAVQSQPNKDSPQGKAGQRLVAPSEVAPDDVEVDVGDGEANGEDGNAYAESLH